MPRPVAVFAHRGASACLPEHTLAAYARAIDDGADWIETDLVSTADGVLVARHENEIGATTDVAQHGEFADRHTRKCIDGTWVEGWFSEDFTLAELKTLRARERLPALRGTAGDGKFTIATLEEIIALIVRRQASLQRRLGLVPEIKHGSYFQQLGLGMEEKLLAMWRMQGAAMPLMIQSFEIDNLKTLRRQRQPGEDMQLLQLIGELQAQPADIVLAGGSLTYAQMLMPEGLARIAAYADVLGVEKAAVMDWDASGQLSKAGPVVSDAQAAGLALGVYTFRPENPFLPPAWRSGAENARNDAAARREMSQFLQAGIDVLFADDPALARQVVDDHLQTSS